MTGQSVLHYEILDKLGEGGMGVVYRARDTKLDRDVALKFLPPHLSASAQDKARFVQEAKAAAALNHPNVCSIIDIHDHPAADGGAGRMFIVMEYVDGMTLRQKMESHGTARPYPLKQAVEIGIQVAEGLAAAHEKGIVHRDVKPENIMVRRDGILQIMDFGLAKLRGAVSRITKAGSTVGTAGYMSPEQVQGQDADHRSDIFSLGVLLYELFTGRLPFKGVHETALMYEIVNVEPEPMSGVNPDLDPELDRIVYECLQKDPDERYQAIKEISRDLKRFQRESSRTRMSKTFAARPGGGPAPGADAAAVRSVSGPGTRTPAARPGSDPSARGIAADGGGAEAAGAGADLPAAGRSKSSGGWPMWAAIALITSVSIVAAFWKPWTERGPERPSGAVTRVTIRFPEEILIPIGTSGTAISPDGRFLAIITMQGLEQKMVLRPADRETFEPVLGSTNPTGQVYYHEFSPDGQWLAFTPGSLIKKASVFGGAPVTICDIGNQPRGVCWGEDGRIYFGHINGVIHQVSDEGGVPVPVTRMDSASGEISHRFPALLPDGRGILYTIKFNNISSFEEAAIAVHDLRDGTRKIVVRGGSYARYVPTGHIVYVRGSYVHAAPFDLDRLEVTGPPKKLFKGGWMNPFSGDANLSFSRDGTLLYVPRGIESYSVSRIRWLDHQGRTEALMDTLGAYWTATISPDGQKLALHVQSANDDLWLYHVGRRNLTRLTFGGGNSGFPVWSPDSRYVYYTSERGGASNIYRKEWDGSGAEELISAGTAGQIPTSVSPDGATLAFVRDGDIWTLDLAGDRTARRFTESAAREAAAVFSPDGRYIAYESIEVGKTRVLISRYPERGATWQISAGGGTNPIWDPSGGKLYYAEGQSINGVDIRTGSGFDYSAPRKILDLPPDGAAVSGISGDGKRFVLVTLPYAELNTSEVTMVTNWFEEIRAAFAAAGN